MTSKSLFIALGLAALVATPALAAKKAVHHNYNYAPDAYASATAPVVEGTTYVGTDPDPAIRSELQRDWPTSIGAN
jgi:hypothetical protein